MGTTKKLKDLSKAEVIKKLNELKAGYKESADEMGGGDDMAFDIADGFLDDERYKSNIYESIKLHWPNVTDIQGFVANWIC
jgi:hypothetical protein